MGKKMRYCPQCGQPLPSAYMAIVTDLDTRLKAAESQLRTIDLQDPRMGAEGWHDTIRRIVREVLRQDGVR